MEPIKAFKKSILHAFLDLPKIYFLHKKIKNNYKF